MHESAPAIVRLVAIAIGVGILAQVVAGRARLPSIVFLLGFGVLVGPDGLGWIDPDELGIGLQAIVTIAVALILFEGGLELRLLDLAAVGGTVRNLVTVGAGVTVLGAAIAAHEIVGLPWPVAFLFGAIVSVTGPTVITPLLHRVRVQRRVDTILRGEGILIDPLGAVLTVVVFDFLISAEATLVDGLLAFGWRMGVGAALGLVGGWVLGRILRVRGLVPEEVKNLFVLAAVLTLLAASEAIARESGLAAVVIAGMAVRRESIPRQNQLRRFKGELSVLFISMLFILLSAHLPLATIAEVGWAGVTTVLVLMWVIRPAAILASTWGRSLSWGERAFLMWISPRGVVAISIASFIALRMELGDPVLVAAGLSAADGEALLALVFLTIAITVVVQGLTAERVAKWLNVNADTGRYVIIVGANPLGIQVGALMQTHGWDVIVIDTNAANARRAREAGLTARAGNVLQGVVRDEIQIESATAIVAVTPNQAVNFLIAQIALEEYRVPAAFPTLVTGNRDVDEERVEEAGADVAFGRSVDIAGWGRRIADEGVRAVELEFGPSAPDGPLAELDWPPGVLPVLRLRGDRATLCHGSMRWNDGDRVVVLTDDEGEQALAATFGVGAATEEELNPVPEADV